LPDGSSGGVYQERIQETLSRIIGKDAMDESYGFAAPNPMRPTISAVFQDGDTVDGGLRHYIANVRIFGNCNNNSTTPTADPYWTSQGIPGGFTPQKLTNMNPSTEIASFWCSNQTSFDAPHPLNKAAAATNSIFLDNNGARTAGFYFIRGMNPELEQGIGLYSTFFKKEVNGGPGPSSGVRTRHLGDTTANFLFVDGHVSSLRAGEIKRQLFCTPAPKR
jgi:prepilin-type processing-associated H-X9-DG protein